MLQGPPTPVITQWTSLFVVRHYYATYRSMMCQLIRPQKKRSRQINKRHAITQSPAITKHDRESILAPGKPTRSGSPQRGRPAFLVVLTAVNLAYWLLPASSVAASTITYKQGNYATTASAQTVKIIFMAAQSAGDLNVVVVGWNDSTTTVRTLVDKSGNTYQRAIGPTVLSAGGAGRGSLSQSIYFAKNIKAATAGANAVTVTFSTAASYPDIRIVEYSGAKTDNVLGVTAAASGNSTTASSGYRTTTNANLLIFGANTVLTMTAGPGSGFSRRLLTPFGDIVEDRMVTATGSYRATAPLTSSGPWIMQMVAFQAASGISVSPKIAASPTSVSFGNVTVGSSASHTITLSNPGSVNVTVSQVTATGSGFKRTGPSLPLTLSTGQSTSFSVTFSPTTSGSVTGSISVVSNASNSPLAVPLSGKGVTGTGVAGTLAIAPASTSFGNVVLGSKAVLPMILTNTGTVSVTISKATISGTGFTLAAPSLPLTLQPGAKNSGFSTTFAPTAVGSFTGSVAFVSNASNSPAKEPLSGAGIHGVSLKWTASTSGVVGYNVYRGSVSGGPYAKMTSSVVTGTTYSDKTVTGGRTYYYVITAVSSNQKESAHSNQAAAAIPSP